jgi:hypothetical protein
VSLTELLSSMFRLPAIMKCGLKRTIIIGLVFCGVGTLSGCRPPGASESGGTLEAFNIRLVRGVKWTTDTLRFDPLLPGYHLRGGIGTIELARKPGIRPAHLVLDIATSPGMPPNLESFTIAWGDTMLRTSSSGQNSLCELIAKNADGEWRMISQRETADYLHFQLTDTSVTVSFLASALSVMERECTVSWIDWYRR